jgi:hypothetical protein
MPFMARSQKEIDNQLNMTEKAVDSGQSAWPGQSYEQGVEAALRWVTGETNDAPMEDD